MSFQSRSSAFVRRAFILLGGIIACVVVLMTWTLFSLAEETNRAAIKDQLARLNFAVEAELGSARQELAIIASGQSGRYSVDDSQFSSKPLDHRLQGAWHYFRFNSVYALDAASRVLSGAEYGVPATQIAFDHVHPFITNLIDDARQGRRLAVQRNEATNSSPGFEERLSRAGLIHDGFGLGLAVAVPFNPSMSNTAGAEVLVGVRALPARTLAEIGIRYGLGQVDFVGVSGTVPSYALPISNARGDNIGYLTWDYSRPGSQLLPNLFGIILASLAAIVAAFVVLFNRLRRLGSAMARDEEAANRLASHDHLSGLLNRRSFGERLAAELDRSRRSHSGFALHLIDLDRFKQINDTYGHQAGDEVIREVGRRISDIVRGADSVGRLGGDEFGIIQVDTDTTHEAGALANRLRDALQRPIRIADTEVVIGCSIGIALAPVSDEGADAHLKLADQALYAAKRDGRNRHRFHDAGGDEGLRLRQLVEEELRDAIVNDHLELHYQPQMSADGRRIVGVEALVRWRHPVRGLIPPLEFISVAEARGLIVPLSNWVLRRACQDGKRWPGLKVAVNVSAAQFKQPGFVRDLIALVSDTGFELGRLELELTEGMIVEDEDNAERAIEQLREEGISLALDDFGTGYSSLIYLRRFSFDKIKIDRSFLESMETTGESAILLHSVVHLGRALGLTVCAEGIETEEQHRFLQAVGCHELQGYLFSRPVPADQIDRLLATAGVTTQAA